MNKCLLAIICCLALSSCGNNKADSPTKSQTATSTIANHGKQLFKNNCMQCHALNQDRTGPMLAGVINRWGNDTSHMIAFIKNSQLVIEKDGTEAYAGKLFKKWYNTVMPSFSNLNDTDIIKVIEYVNAGVE